MPQPPRILAFSGSLREGSYNHRLVRIAAGAARRAGAEVTEIRLRDFDLPLFDEDLESRHGLPEACRRLKEILRAHQGMLIASPEYNSSVSGALKNAIDWASRPEPGQPPLSCFAGKVAGVMSASTGRLAGIRSQVHLRAILVHIGMLVVPQNFALPNAGEAFLGDGNLRDPDAQKAVEAIGTAVATMVMRLHTQG
jgi:chromate reductase